jgi:hypothetical protein
MNRTGMGILPAALAAGLWCAAACGVAPAESRIDNGLLTVSAQEGGPGITVETKGPQGKTTRVEIVLRGEDGSSPALQQVTSRNEKTMHVVAGSIAADVTAERKQPFLTVTPARPGGSLEVRAKACYAVLPDFFGYDVVYEPVRFKGNTLRVAAENFLLSFIEGHRAILMCVWPGGLSKAKGRGAEARQSEANAREPAVDLILEGEGAARRMKARRIEFTGGPIHVAVLERDNLWYDQDVSGWEAQTPTALEWKRPFDAHWRLNTLVAEGKKTKDLITRSQSYRFLYMPPPEKRGRVRRNKMPGAHIEDIRALVDRNKIWSKGHPVVYEERIYSHIYSAWFKNDETYVALFADNPRKGNKENIYDRILIYPIDRDKSAPQETPLDVYTFVDIMRQTLGQGPCEYILDLEGVHSRGAGGDRDIVDDATCSIWLGHIFPYTKAKELPDEKKAHLVKAVKDLLPFLHAVYDRIVEYDEFNKRLIAHLKKAEANEAVKPVAGRIAELAEAMKKMLAKYNVPKFKTQVEQWDKKIPEIAAKVEAGDFGAAAGAGGTRRLGQAQDNAVADCRRYVKAIRHEVSFIETDNIDIQRLVLDVRNMCQDILRNAHPKELAHTDPNSPRIGLTRDQR